MVRNGFQRPWTRDCGHSPPANSENFDLLIGMDAEFYPYRGVDAVPGDASG